MKSIPTTNIHLTGSSIRGVGKVPAFSFVSILLIQESCSSLHRTLFTSFIYGASAQNFSGTLLGDRLHSLLNILDGGKSLSFEDGFDLGKQA